MSLNAAQVPPPTNASPSAADATPNPSFSLYPLITPPFIIKKICIYGDLNVQVTNEDYMETD